MKRGRSWGGFITNERDSWGMFWAARRSSSELSDELFEMKGFEVTSRHSIGDHWGYMKTGEACGSWMGVIRTFTINLFKPKVIPKLRASICTRKKGENGKSAISSLIKPLSIEGIDDVCNHCVRSLFILCSFSISNFLPISLVNPHTHYLIS